MGQNKLLVNGKLIKSANNLSLKDRKEISSITTYINEKHGLAYLQPYFYQNLDSLLKHDVVKNNDQNEKILELINVKYIGEFDEVENDTRISFNSMFKNEMMNVAGYEYYIGHYSNRIFGAKTIDSSTYHFDKEQFTVVLNSNSNSLTLKMNNSNALVLNMAAELKSLEKIYGSVKDKLPDSVLTFKGNDSMYVYKLILGNIDAKKEKGVTHIANISGKILIAKKK